MEPYVDEYLMDKYIENTIEKNIPLIAFCENHLKYITEYLEENYPEFDLEIDKKLDDLVSCKHYPFTCCEAYKYLKDSHDENPRYFDCCDCNGICADDDCHTVPDRHYWEFSWKDEFMEHYDNCYDDCCCISEIKERYFIILNNCYE